MDTIDNILDTSNAPNASLATASGNHPLRLRLADTFRSRFTGLMLAPPLQSGHGLLITRCTSVHTMFMRRTIDVVYLDRHGAVTGCVPLLRPWRGSFSTGRGAAHALELSAGSIAALDIRPGDSLQHACLRADAMPAAVASNPARQRGSAMIEFTVVGPIITLFGLSMVQYGMLFFAKDQITHAGFMAAREGANANASLDKVYLAYVRALVPMYGGGQTAPELAGSLAKAAADIGPNSVGNVNIELLNPTRESFDDWNDPALQNKLKTGSRRVIPNSGQAYKDQKVGATSGQTLQDANLIKLRITHGYRPKVPLVGNIYGIYLKWLDPHTDAFHTKLVDDGRIPVVSHITLHMQSDAIEPGAPVSSPGAGNGGNPVNPSPPDNPANPPAPTSPPPNCTNNHCEPAAPACNPMLDPNRCHPVACDSESMCCAPTGESK